MSNLDELQTQIDAIFHQTAEQTSLAQRVRDLVGQANALGCFNDLWQLREETGRLLCNLLQLCNECQWSSAELIAATLEKMRIHAKQPAVATVRRSPQKVAVFASTFDPPSLYHRTAVERLLERGFDEVLVRPTGPRSGRNEREHALAMHRAAMIDLAFGHMPRVTVDLSDLDEGRSTPPSALEERYAQDAELWHVVSDQQIVGGQEARSAIHLEWTLGAELWQRSRFIILHAPDAPPLPDDLPPRHCLLALGNHLASAELRNRVYNGQSINDWVMPEIADYIRRHDLFAPLPTAQPRPLQLREIRLLIEYDASNPQAAELAKQYQPWVSDSPNLILVIGGDGSMLHAIRAHWRKRIPIVGLNAGHFGFLANERLPLDLSTVQLFSYPVPLMRVTAESNEGALRRELAFGDAWVERGGGQAAWLRLDMNGETRVPKIVGDGMLVATASGSPAYARAMGAIPVPLTTPVMILAGSNIFRPRFWKPMTLANTMLLSLVNLDETGKRPLRGFVDGLPLGIVRSLTVQRSPIASVELAYTSEFDPSEKLLRSLFPPLEEGT